METWNIINVQMLDMRHLKAVIQYLWLEDKLSNIKATWWRHMWSCGHVIRSPVPNLFISAAAVALSRRSRIRSNPRRLHRKFDFSLVSQSKRFRLPRYLYVCFLVTCFVWVFTRRLCGLRPRSGTSFKRGSPVWWTCRWWSRRAACKWQ